MLYIETAANCHSLKLVKRIRRKWLRGAIYATSYLRLIFFTSLKVRQVEISHLRLIHRRNRRLNRLHRLLPLRDLYTPLQNGFLLAWKSWLASKTDTRTVVQQLNVSTLLGCHLNCKTHSAWILKSSFIQNLSRSLKTEQNFCMINWTFLSDSKAYSWTSSSLKGVAFNLW